MTPPLLTRPLARALLGGLGWIAVALAVVGAVVPGVPMTVFLLAASWCFSRSSPRFDAWLRGHVWLGPAIRRFSGRGGMPRSAKRLAQASMWPAIAVSAVSLMGPYPLGALLTVALGAIGAVAIQLVVPTVPEC